MAAIRTPFPVQPYNIATLLTASLESASQVNLPNLLQTSGLQINQAPQFSTGLFPGQPVQPVFMQPAQQPAFQSPQNISSILTAMAQAFSSAPSSTAAMSSNQSMKPVSATKTTAQQLNLAFQRGLSSSQAAKREANHDGWVTFEKSLTADQKAAQDKWKRLKAQGAPTAEWKAAQNAYASTFTPKQKALHDQAMALSSAFKTSLSAQQAKALDAISEVKTREWLAKQA